MKDKQAERKHRKSLVRKKIVSEKKKSKLSDEMMIQAMQNMEILETQRRIAILEFLAAEWFKEPKKQEDPNIPHFSKARTLYKLMKINYKEEVKLALWEDLTKYQGIYMITDIKTQKKGIIFQVTYSKNSWFNINKIHKK